MRFLLLLLLILTLQLLNSEAIAQANKPVTASVWKLKTEFRFSLPDSSGLSSHDAAKAMMALEYMATIFEYRIESFRIDKAIYLTLSFDTVITAIPEDVINMEGDWRQRFTFKIDLERKTIAAAGGDSIYVYDEGDYSMSDTLIHSLPHKIFRFANHTVVTQESEPLNTQKLLQHSKQSYKIIDHSSGKKGFNYRHSLAFERVRAIKDYQTVVDMFSSEKTLPVSTARKSLFSFALMRSN